MSDKFALVLPDLSAFGIEETVGERVWEKLQEQTKDFELVRVNFTKFGDGSFKPELNKSVRNRQVYVFVSPEVPASEQVMTTALALDACRRANADKHGINLMETYNPWYAQDKRDVGRRESNSGRAVSQNYISQGLSHLFYFEPHSHPAIDGWYDSVDPIFMSSFHAAEVAKEFELENSVAAAPDDSFGRVKHFAKALGIPLVKIGKVRKHDELEKAHAMDVKDEEIDGKTVFIYDDMIRTGGTIIGAAESAKIAGAERVIPVATHLLIYDPDKLFGSEYIDAVRGTNTVPRHPTHEKLREHDIANFAAQIIYRKTHDMDVSEFILSRAPTYGKFD